MLGGKTDADKARVQDAMSQLTKMGEQAEHAENDGEGHGQGSEGRRRPMRST